MSACSQHQAGKVLCTECGGYAIIPPEGDALWLPPALRIQASIVRRRATIIAKAAKKLDDFSALPAMVFTLEEMPAIRSALIFALAVLDKHDYVPERFISGPEPRS